MNKNKGLDHDEQLLFEVGNIDKTGVDLAELDNLGTWVHPGGSESRIDYVARPVEWFSNTTEAGRHADMLTILHRQLFTRQIA